MRALILVASACLALAACQPSPAVNNNTDVAANTVTANDHVAAANPGCGIATNTLADEKALFVAETAYNIPANAYVQLGANLPAAKRAEVRKLLIQAYDGLKLARKAYNAGDGCSLNSYVELVKSLGQRAQAILPKG